MGTVAGVVRRLRSKPSIFPHEVTERREERLSQSVKRRATQKWPVTASPRE